MTSQNEGAQQTAVMCFEGDPSNPVGRCTQKQTKRKPMDFHPNESNVGQSAQRAKDCAPPQSVHSQTPTGQNKATQRDKRMERLQETVKTKSKIKKKKKKEI